MPSTSTWPGNRSTRRQSRPRSSRRGCAPYVSETVVDGQKWYRLRAGPFVAEADARRVLASARTRYPKAWLAVSDDTAITATGVPGAVTGVAKSHGSRQRDADAAGHRPDDEARRGADAAQGLSGGDPAAHPPHRAAGVPPARAGPGAAWAGAGAQRATGTRQGRVRGIPAPVPAGRGSGARQQALARADLRGQPGEPAGPCSERGRVALARVRRRVANLPSRQQQLRQWHRVEQPHDAGRAAERRCARGAPQRRALRLRHARQRCLRARPDGRWPRQRFDRDAAVRGADRPDVRLDGARRAPVRATSAG